MVKGERYPSAAAARALVRVSDWLESKEGRGKLATCLTQAVGPSEADASGEENLKNAEL